VLQFQPHAVQVLFFKQASVSAAGIYKAVCYEDNPTECDQIMKTVDITNNSDYSDTPVYQTLTAQF